MTGPTGVKAELFTAPEHGFKIDFPVKPQSTSTQAQTASGLTRVTRYAARQGALRTSLTVITFSRRTFTDAEVTVGLTQSRNRQVRAFNGELVSEKDMEIDGHRGQELVIAMGRPGKPRNFRYRVRTYYVKNRQYLMSVIGTPGQVAAPDADAFFTFFTLVK